MRYVVNAELLNTKEMAHNHLVEVFEFPEYYGRNLDALYDCLSECEDIEIEVQGWTEETMSGYARRIVRVLEKVGQVRFDVSAGESSEA